MNKIKKIFAGILVSVLSVGLLAGCGAPKPTDAVDSFLTAFQKGDIKTAGSFVEKGSLDSVVKDTSDAVDSKQLFDALSKNYKFEKPTLVSTKGDKAKVKVKITSVDISIAFTSAMGEVMPMAFASAFSDDSDSTDKTMETMMESSLIKNLTKDDATMKTREVTLNLKKDKDGNYKLVDDDNLEEALLANASKMEDMFGK